MTPCPQFTIRQAIAWIIWHDADRPLQLSRPDVDDKVALALWWADSAKIERGVRDAALQLAEKIRAGTVFAAGRRVLEGVPWSGASRWEYVDRIPAGTAQNLVVIPVDWIEVSDGGWLLINDREVNGVASGARFCGVTVDANQVKAVWRVKRADHDKLVEFLTHEARKVLDKTKHVGKRPDLIRHCVRAMKCTNDAAEAAFQELPADLRRQRGQRG